MAVEESVRIPGADKAFRLVQAIAGIEFPPKLRKAGLRDMAKRLSAFASQLSNDGVMKAGGVERPVGKPRGRPVGSKNGVAMQPKARRAVGPKKIRTRLPPGATGDFVSVRRGPGRPRKNETLPRQLEVLTPANGMDDGYHPATEPAIETPSV